MDFQKASPKHNDLICSAAWHLRKSGLYLATYDLVGAITRGGERPFFATIKKVSGYFGSDYETQRRVFIGLRRSGWLDMDSTGDMRFIAHEVWAQRHPGKCRERAALTWDFEKDPLVSELYAMSGGRLRVFENQIVGLRNLADDQKIAKTFRRLWAEALAAKDAGEFRTVSPKKVFWLLHRILQKDNELLHDREKVAGLR